MARSREIGLVAAIVTLLAIGLVVAQDAAAQEALPNPQAYNNRGPGYFKKGDHDRAIADYTRAIQLNLEYLAAYGNRHIAYRMKGDIDRAIADYNQAIKLSRKYLQANGNHGELDQVSFLRQPRHRLSYEG